MENETGGSKVSNPPIDPNTLFYDPDKMVKEFSRFCENLTVSYIADHPNFIMEWLKKNKYPDTIPNVLNLTIQYMGWLKDQFL